MNKQRQAVYGLRRALLEGRDMKERALDIIRGIVATYIDMRCPEKAHPSAWDLTGLQSDVLTQFGVRIDTAELAEMGRQEVEDSLIERLNKRYDEKELMVSPELMRHMERIVMLQVIDNQWKDHLLSMDHLKEGIGLRGYGQKDPLIEYKKESFQLFQDMMDRIEDETVRYLFFLQREEGQSSPQGPYPDVDEDEDEDSGGEPVATLAASSEQKQAAQSAVQDFTRNVQRKKEKEMAELQFAGSGTPAPKAQVIAGPKVGRNDPCPCGSGKKYKKCHGANS
jgi:preprotein translocase subunit SecA